MKRALLFLACVGAGSDEDLCREGIPPACYNVAVAYETGPEKNLDRALALYDVACDADLGVACVNAGVLRAHGEGVPQDLPAAIRLFRRGCELHAAEGCHDLGTVLVQGIGATPDPVAGVSFLERGCELGHAAACARAADFWKTGVRTSTVVVQKNRVKAKSLEAKACALDLSRC